MEVKQKKRKYMGRRKYNKIQTIFLILLANIRDYKSKEVSLKKMINK